MEKTTTEKPKYFAKKDGIGYGGVDLDRGQIVELGGFRNDDKLIDMGYLLEVSEGTKVYKCAICDAEFVGQPQRDAHYDKRHVDRVRSSAMPTAMALMSDDAVAGDELSLGLRVGPLHPASR